MPGAKGRLSSDGLKEDIWLVFFQLILVFYVPGNLNSVKFHENTMKLFSSVYVLTNNLYPFRESVKIELVVYFDQFSNAA